MSMTSRRGTKNGHSREPVSRATFQRHTAGAYGMQEHYMGPLHKHIQKGAMGNEGNMPKHAAMGPTELGRHTFTMIHVTSVAIMQKSELQQGKLLPSGGAANKQGFAAMPGVECMQIQIDSWTGRGRVRQGQTRDRAVPAGPCVQLGTDHAAGEQLCSLPCPAASQLPCLPPPSCRTPAVHRSLDLPFTPCMCCRCDDRAL